jgi:hypothetical protein
MVANAGKGTLTLTDMGAILAIAIAIAIATGDALTLFTGAPPNEASGWLRVVDEVTRAVFEREIAAYLLANTQFPSPSLFTNSGATPAAVACDCSGVYLETDY